MIDSPRAKGFYGGVVAAPIFQRIADAALRHRGVPPSINALPPVLIARHSAEPEALTARPVVATEVETALESCKLIIPIPAHDMKVLIVRDADVPAYVEHGAADLGIAGRDVLEVEDRDLYEPLDLGIGRCRMVVAEPEDHQVDEIEQIHLRYATTYPELTRRVQQSRGVVAEIIKLYGSIEIAPLVGLADRIVDLVSSGETLRQHRLREVETIMEVSARLCVGRAAAKLRSDRIDDLVARLRAVVTG